MEKVLSFEGAVLSSYDWVKKTEAPSITSVVQDDYDDCRQEVYVKYSDGRYIKQIRDWDRTGNAHDTYLALGEQGASPAERFAYIQAHSSLVEEEDLPSVPNTSESDPIVTEVTLESINQLSMELRHEIWKNVSNGVKQFGKLSETFAGLMARQIGRAHV